MALRGLKRRADLNRATITRSNSFLFCPLIYAPARIIILSCSIELSLIPGQSVSKNSLKRIAAEYSELPTCPIILIMIEEGPPVQRVFLGKVGHL